MSDAGHDAIAVLTAKIGVLGNRLAALRREKAKLALLLVDAGKTERRVTDHALLRFLERHKDIDVSGMRQELRAIADASRSFNDGEHHIHESGVVLILGDEGQVITVLSPEQAEKWDGRKLKTAYDPLARGLRPMSALDEQGERMR